MRKCWSRVFIGDNIGNTTLADRRCFQHRRSARAG
jgi:hypothetical protein